MKPITDRSGRSSTDRNTTAEPPGKSANCAFQAASVGQRLQPNFGAAAAANQSGNYSGAERWESFLFFLAGSPLPSFSDER